MNKRPPGGARGTAARIRSPSFIFAVDYPARLVIAIRRFVAAGNFLRNPDYSPVGIAFRGLRVIYLPSKPAHRKPKNP
jgi:hypothetical protein